MVLNRRHFTLGLAAAALPRLALAAPMAAPRVVVIGAGAAGLGFVRALRKLLPPGRVKLHIIEPQDVYRPPFGSTRVLSGAISFEQLAHPYPEIDAVERIPGRVQSLDPVRRRIRLTDSRELPYDFLIVAPGVEAAEDFPGHDALGWFNDASLATLLRRLDALPASAEIVMSVPHLPYRCPPAPYERAGLMLLYLRARNRSDVHVTILDAKDQFSQQAQFLSDWERRWPGRIEWLAPDIHDGVQAVDAGRIVTGFGDFRGDLIHAIPAQRAPSWCADAGLADFTGYCPVELPSFRSAKHDGVYVIGDAAAAGEMPKSASAALSHAAHAATDLAGQLGVQASSEPLWALCFGRLDQDVAIVSHSEFADDGRRLKEDLSPYPLDEKQAAADFAAAEDWYRRALRLMGLKHA